MDMMNSSEDSISFSRSGAATGSVSALPNAHARTNAARILNGLATTGAKTVADIYERDVSMVSKWKEDGQFEKMATMLATMGLKVVPIDWQVMDTEQVTALLTLNRAYMATLTAEKLVAGE
jgi:hypothetical protein